MKALEAAGAQPIAAQHLPAARVTFDGIDDPTGYLFSLAKSIACAVKHSPWAQYAEDIVATSGFAFRMWVREDLCGSATSTWYWNNIKPWVESGGFACAYIGRYWDEKKVEKKKRLEAVALAKQSIDRGIPAVSWDIGLPEWGLLTGYDDKAKTFAALSQVKGESEMPYKKLGKCEIPILCLLAITGRTGKSQENILRDTMRLAVTHLEGREDCDRELTQGLAAYPSLIKHFEAEDSAFALCWNMEYHLGTYGALKHYAWKYFQKMEQRELAGLYREIADAWLAAFEIKRGEEINQPEGRQKIAAFLKNAHERETQAVEIMRRGL